MNEFAIPPIMGRDVINAFKKIKEPTITSEDRKLMSISELQGDPRWELVVEYIDGLISSYVKVDITESDTPTTVGVKYMIADKIMKILTPLRTLPEDLGNQYDKENQESRRKGK